MTALPSLAMCGLLWGALTVGVYAVVANKLHGGRPEWRDE